MQWYIDTHIIANTCSRWFLSKERDRNILLYSNKLSIFVFLLYMFIYTNLRCDNQFCRWLVSIKTLVNTQPKNQLGWWFRGLTATDLGSASCSCSHSVWKAGLAVVIWSPKVSPGPAILVGGSARDFRDLLFLLPTLSPPLSQTQPRGKAWHGAGMQRQKPQPGWMESPTCWCQLCCVNMIF